MHVPGHAGFQGNEEADRLAREGASKQASWHTETTDCSHRKRTNIPVTTWTAVNALELNIEMYIFLGWSITYVSASGVEEPTFASVAFVLQASQYLVDDTDSLLFLHLTWRAAVSVFSCFEDLWIHW